MDGGADADADADTDNASVRGRGRVGQPTQILGAAELEMTRSEAAGEGEAAAPVHAVSR